MSLICMHLHRADGDMFCLCEALRGWRFTAIQMVKEASVFHQARQPRVHDPLTLYLTSSIYIPLVSPSFISLSPNFFQSSPIKCRRCAFLQKKRYVSFVHVTRVTSTFLQAPSILQYLGAMAAKKETTVQEHFNRTTNWDILATVGIFLNNTSGEFPAVEDKTRSFPILKSTVPTFLQAIGLISFCQCLMRPFPPPPSPRLFVLISVWGVGGHCNLRLTEPTKRRIQSTWHFLSYTTNLECT